MKQEDVLNIIRDQWFALPATERNDENQRAVFALKMSNTYSFRCKGDRYQVIKGYLDRLLNNIQKT